MRYFTIRIILPSEEPDRTMSRVSTEIHEDGARTRIRTYKIHESIVVVYKSVSYQAATCALF